MGPVWFITPQVRLMGRARIQTSRFWNYWRKIEPHRAVGLGFALLILVLLFVHRSVVTGFCYQVPDYTFLFVGVALITGIVFWVCTGSSGVLTVKELGLRLGGGAAIGAGFMLLAFSLIRQLAITPPPAVVEVELSAAEADNQQFLKVSKVSGELEPHLRRDGRVVFVKFTGCCTDGTIVSEYVAEAVEEEVRTVKVTRRVWRGGRSEITKREGDK
jgi:hypothetical protein